MSVPAVDALTLAQAARMMREAVVDRTYQTFPIGQDVAEYLWQKRKRLTKDSYRKYEGTLRTLAGHFLDLDLADLEPPVGRQRVEEFMDRQWGHLEPRTYNSNLSIVSDFFQWTVREGRLHGDPTLRIERAKARGVHREVFTADARRAILAENPDLRDRLALRLLLDYALRKAALGAVQFKHFDHARKRLTIFTKGGKVRNVPIPDPAFWDDLGRLLIDTGAQPDWYLLPAARGNRHASRPMHTKQRSAHSLHNWWYARLTAAGIVATGTTKGERMHKARHSAGQRLLDHTGNLKAVQQLLGHQSVATTGDIYVGWDEAALAASLESALDAETKRGDR